MSYKCIIIEGPDNCGKDTACDLLRAEILNRTDKYPVCVYPKFNKHIDDFKRDMREFKVMVREFIENMPDNYVLICNRSHLDEYIYGSMYRDYSDAELSYLFDDDGVQDSILYVYLTDTPEVLSAREDGLSFSEGSVEKIAEEVQKFDDLYNNVSFSKIRLVTSSIAKEAMGSYIFQYFTL